jgi:hypothetical protein
MPLHYTDRPLVEQPRVLVPDFDQTNVPLSFRARAAMPQMVKSPSKTNKMMLWIILIIAILALLYGVKMMKQNKEEFFYF